MSKNNRPFDNAQSNNRRLGADEKVEHETSFKLGQTYIEHGDVDSALIYLQKFYDYCQRVNDEEGFGQASEALAICYQKSVVEFQ